MLPRIVTRTHYQVDEPAYLRVLIEDCASPIKSDYPERIAQRLEARLRELRRDFNFAAAKYCVDLARALDLITENNFWTWSAHVLRLLAPRPIVETNLDLTLSLQEQVFFFRMFLEFDGAAFLFFGRRVLLDGSVRGNWNQIADDLMETTYRAYLEMATDLHDRVSIRQTLEKRHRQPYKGKSGPHQCFVHLQTMARLGLLQSTGRDYSTLSAPESAPRLGRLLRAVPDIASLEGVIARRELPRVAAEVFITSATMRSWEELEIATQARELYQRVIETGVTLCSLNTMIEAIQFQQVTKGIMPITYEECVNLLRQAQARDPKRIRFQVDRVGRPAFISFS